jgi:hypothetical protein
MPCLLLFPKMWLLAPLRERGASPRVPVAQELDPSPDWAV